MATYTNKVGLTKPAGGENKQVAALNDNFDKIDSALGVQWVADGSLPGTPFVGAPIKELTSGKEFVLQTDGLGGWLKKTTRAALADTATTATTATNATNATNLVGSITSYFKNVTNVTASSPNNTWQVIAGSSVSWTVGGSGGLTLVTANVDVSQVSTTSILYFRISGDDSTQSFPLIGGGSTVRQSTQVQKLLILPTSGTFSLGMDCYVSGSGGSNVNAIRYQVQTQATLT